MARDGRRRLQVAVVAGVGIVVLVVVAALALASSGRGGGKGSSTEPSAFDLPALRGGGRVRLADHRGQPVVVNFFASWCSSCDFELPGFARVSNELEGRVTFLGVDALETGDPLVMPRRHHITWWPLAKDVAGANGSGLHDALGGGNGMPITAFYDAAGKLRAVERGALPESTLRTRLHDLYGL